VTTRFKNVMGSTVKKLKQTFSSTPPALSSVTQSSSIAPSDPMASQPPQESKEPHQPRRRTRHLYASDREAEFVAYDGSSILWDPKTNPLDDCMDKITQTPDGQYLYTLDDNSVIHVWKVDEGQELLNNQAVVYRRPGDFKLFYDWTMYVHRCDPVSDQPSGYPKQHDMCVRQEQKDGPVIFFPFHTRDPKIHGHRVGVWDFSSTRIVAWCMSATRLYILHRRADLSASFLSTGRVDPSGVYALNSREDISSSLLSLGWLDPLSGQYTYLFDLHWKHDSNYWSTQMGLSIMCSPDEKLMCASTQGRELNVYDLAAQKCICTIKEPRFSFLTRVVFSRDNRWLYVVGNCLHIYDVAEELPSPKWSSPKSVWYRCPSDFEGTVSNACPFLRLSADGTTLYLHGPDYRGAKMDVRPVGEGQWWPLHIKITEL